MRELSMSNATKTHRIFLSTLTVLVALVTLSGCSAYHKILQTDDTDGKYEMAMDFYADEKYEKAIVLLDNAMPMLMGSAREDSALFTLGKIFYERKEYYTSGETMNQYRNKFPRTGFTPEAEYIYAMSFYMLSPDVEKDQQNTYRAITAFNEYVNRYPNSPYTSEITMLIEELNNKLYYKKYYNAALYFKLRQYRAAVTSLSAVLKENPETPYREDILYLICKSWFEYAKNSIYSKQLDRYLNSIDAYYNFITAYPESKQFGRELLRMKDYAQAFVNENGVTSQSMETSVKKIEAAKKEIEEATDKLFLARTSEERKELRETIKNAQEIVRVESKKARAEAKIIRDNERAKEKQLREEEKQEKEAQKAKEEEERKQRQQRVQELREKVSAEEQE